MYKMIYISAETWNAEGFDIFFEISKIQNYITQSSKEKIKEENKVKEQKGKTQKNKIFKHMATISKNVYFDMLDDIVNKYNNTVHRTIKMKPIEVTDDSYAEYNEDFNKKDPKFKVSDHVRISKYKNIFAKGYAPNWSKEVFV